MTNNIINGFFDKYRFLSNFDLTPVLYHDILFPSNENAFQYEKGIGTMDLKSPHMRRFYEAVGVEANGQTSLLPVYTPSEAKKFGKAPFMTLRPDWDVEVEGKTTRKEVVMYELTCAKYSSFPMQMRLLDTGDALLIEGNWWHDNTWGNCIWSGRDRLHPCSRCINVEGKNKLGLILMRRRNEIAKTFAK